MSPARELPKECLRCDWSGSMDGSVCPHCAATLFRPAQARVPRRPTSVSAGTAPPPDDAFPPAPIQGAPDEHDGRRRRALVIVITGLALVASTTWFVRRHVTDQGPASSLPRSGTIVYAVDDGQGWSRLWQWSLESGRVRPGARVREPTTLVNAYGAAPGLLGITSMTSDGRSTGSLLRFFGPSDSPVPLVQGDLVTWGGRGIAVVAVKRGPISAECRRITIVTRTVIPPSSERQFSERVCGDILSVGRDATATYFTMWDGEDADILLASYGRTREILPDHALLSLSPATDMLVVPSRDLAALRLAPLAVRANEGPPLSSVFGTSLYFRGLSRPRTYGGRGGHLWIDRVLSWANDSTSALVVGSYQDRTGLFEIEAGPSRTLSAPRYLEPIKGVMWASYADDGRAFVAAEGTISVVEATGMAPLPLPPGAPRPDGPIVWLP
jgi:hypothetical protein